MKHINQSFYQPELCVLKEDLSYKKYQIQLNVYLVKIPTLKSYN